MKAGGFGRPEVHSDAAAYQKRPKQVTAGGGGLAFVALVSTPKRARSVRGSAKRECQPVEP